MKTEKKYLGKGEWEITATAEFAELEKHFPAAAANLSEEMKLDGFRPGKAPLDVVRQKVGDIVLLEAASRIFIDKNFKDLFNDLSEIPYGQPKVELTKLAWDNPLEFKVVVAVVPTIDLSEYKDFCIKKNKAEATDEEVDKVIEDLRESRAKEALVSREIEKGDKVVLTLEMFLDNVPVDTGAAKEVALIVGKKYIVPGFDEKIMGAKTGDKREFAITYPADFYQANLAGKSVDFQVEIKSIYERVLPPADDSLAAMFGHKKLDEMKEGIKKEMAQEKEMHEKEKCEMEIIEKISKSSKFGDIPEIMINYEIEGMIKELEHNIERSGAKMDDYLSSIKKTRADLMLEFAPRAVDRIKAALIVRAIIEKEKIEVGDEEVEKELQALITNYAGYEKVLERVKTPEYRRRLHAIILNRKVSDSLLEWNTKE